MLKGKTFASAASTAAVEGSAPSFRPGSFPVVFNAAAPEASVDVWFTPDISTVGEHADSVFEAYGASDSFTHFLADSNALNDDAAEKLASQFEGAGVLCAAQSICQAHQTAGFPVGDFSPLVQSDLVHTRSVRQVMAQYGDVRFDRVGQRYSVAHYNQTVKAFIRQANKAFFADTASNRRAQRTCWWLPVERGDLRTRFILASKYSALVKSRGVGFTPDCSWLEERILPTASGSPPVWEASVFTEGEVKLLASLWSVFPTTADAFVQVFGNKDLLELLGLSWVKPSKSDLYWGTNFKDIASKMLDTWAARAPVLRKSFEVADKSISAGSSGSTAQIGSTDSFRGVFITSLSLDNGLAISSLAAAFFPKAVFCPTKEVDVKLTTTAPVHEKAVAWIQKDLR